MPDYKSMGEELLEIIGRYKYDRVIELINEGADLTLKDEDEERTALSLLSDSVLFDKGKTTAPEGCMEVMQLLIDKGADVNTIDDSDYTPLHYACIIGKYGLDRVRLLVENNADVNVKTDMNNTPLSFAAESGCFELVKYLVEHNADTNDTLVYAKGEKVKEYLKEHGAT